MAAQRVFSVAVLLALALQAHAAIVCNFAVNGTTYDVSALTLVAPAPYALLSGNCWADCLLFLWQ
jgi:hypothetical protein